MDGLWFSQVGEGHNVACLVVIALFVGDPHLDAGDQYRRGDIGQILHRLIEMVVEVVRQEEVTVLIV